MKQMILISFLLIGCSHTYMLDKDSPNEFFELVNKKIKKKKGVIRTADGEQYNVKEMKVFVDSTSWADLNAHSSEARANTELDRIVIKNHVQGAIVGLELGLVSGFASGALEGAVFYPSGFHSLSSSRTKSAAVSGILLAPVGGLFGLIGGAVIGRKEIFLFNQSSL